MWLHICLGVAYGLPMRKEVLPVRKEVLPGANQGLANSTLRCMVASWAQTALSQLHEPAHMSPATRAC